MEIGNYKCDICGATELAEHYDLPKGWYSLRRETEESDYFYRGKDICPKCVSKANLKAIFDALSKNKKK